LNLFIYLKSEISFFDSASIPASLPHYHCQSSFQHTMAASKSTNRLRVAISGGGLAGATVASALQSNPHLEVNIYESAAQFSERGAAVGISVNGQRALAEIGTEVRDALDKAGAVTMNSSRMMIVCFLYLE
jgi:hypothetical protein